MRRRTILMLAAVLAAFTFATGCNGDLSAVHNCTWNRHNSHSRIVSTSRELFTGSSIKNLNFAFYSCKETWTNHWTICFNIYDSDKRLGGDGSYKVDPPYSPAYARTHNAPCGATVFT